MHPDEATEDIVDLALSLEKPFAVVPCCVFWKANQGREVEGQTVKTWQQYCDYLQRKDARIKRVELPFSGACLLLSSPRHSDACKGEAHHQTRPPPRGAEPTCSAQPAA